MKRMWMIRAGENAFLMDDFISRSIVSLGWNEVGDIQKYKTRETLKDQIEKCYPEYKKGKINITAAQLYRFAFELKKEDYVVTYNPTKRTYHIGEIASEYEYTNISNYPHCNIIKVNWIKGRSRDVLSSSARNSLGAIMSLFEITSSTYDELLADHIQSKPEDEVEANEEYDTIKDNIIGQAHEFIKDKLLALDWEEMQELVAGILRAMGYKTRVSPKGPDRGRDVIASPDGLGLEEPRIIVEVKHRTSGMGANEIRSFTGGLRQRDRGLYVSTGGFSKEAKYEAERSNIPVTLIDSDELVRLITQYYDVFDSDTKALIPLKKIYWPL